MDLISIWYTVLYKHLPNIMVSWQSFKRRKKNKNEECESRSICRFLLYIYSILVIFKYFRVYHDSLYPLLILSSIFLKYFKRGFYLILMSADTASSTSVACPPLGIYRVFFKTELVKWFCTNSTIKHLSWWIIKKGHNLNFTTNILHIID